MRRALAQAGFAVADAGAARVLGAVRPIGHARSRVSVVDVAVSIVQSRDGRVLLAERTARQLAAGFWELPGGKIEPGETPVQAAARELAEEIGIQGEALAPWIMYEHAFTRKVVRLHFFHVVRWSGTPHGREGQRLAWVDPALPHVGPILPSNDRLLTAIGLPACLVRTPGGDVGLARQFAASLPGLLEAGVRLIAIREPQLTADQRVVFARGIMESARPFQAHVWLTGSVLQKRRAGVSGMFSTLSELHRCEARPPVRLWAVSCRRAADLDRAAALNADVAVLSLGGGDVGGPSTFSDGDSRLASPRPLIVYAEEGAGSAPSAHGTIARRISGLFDGPHTL
jgi:8-oxo-dGTP diphosphatase